MKSYEDLILGVSCLFSHVNPWQVRAAQTGVEKARPFSDELLSMIKGLVKKLKGILGSTKSWLRKTALKFRPRLKYFLDFVDDIQIRSRFETTTTINYISTNYYDFMRL